MDNIFFIMLPAFCECLILVGIHSYLGLHVIKRKVIFVDLALAQIAAMGTTVAFLFGVPPLTPGAFWFSLLLTIIGAMIFSLCRLRSGKIPQEAIIGLVYALAASVGILIIDKAPQGASHLKHLLIGSILWVKWGTIGKTAIVYLLVGVFHYIFRAKFILISEDPQSAWARGINVRFWDFLFYLSFGIVITYSVGTAGVLLVFVFLIAPAIMALILTDKWIFQLIIGWAMGFLVSATGLWTAYRMDLSTGPTVIVMYGLLLLLIAVIYSFVKAENILAAIVRSIGIVALFSLMFFTLFAMGKFLKPSSSSESHTHQTHSITAKAKKLQDMDEKSLKNYLQNISNIDKLKTLFDKNHDPQTQTAIIERVITLSPVTGAKMALEFVNSKTYLFSIDLKERQCEESQIPKYLSAAFGKNDCALSEMATFEIKEREIDDIDEEMQERRYIIVKKENSLEVYLQTKADPFFINSLMLRLSPLIPKGIDKNKSLSDPKNQKAIRRWIDEMEK